MKKFLYKFLFTFLIYFSFIFVFASEVNPSYAEYLKLSDKVKEGVGLVPSEYVNYYELDNNILKKSKTLGLYGNSVSSYDLRNVNGKRLIPEVKDQNPLSLCWAFATNNMIESYLIKNGKNYNLSENHLDYVSRYYKDTSTFGQANSYFNVIKYLFRGYGPFNEDNFGSYFTTSKSLNYDTYLDYDNTLFDINKLVVFPMLRMQYIKETFNATLIKSYVDNYNATLKEHIMNYGAIASGVYWDFYNQDTNLIYNDGSLTREEYSDSAHAITIIGWDDNYGSVNINGNIFTGSWLAMNSWGNVNQYFYISYYDENVVEALLGIKNITEKKWDNVYFDSVVYESSGNKKVYEFTKDNIKENINSVKIFHYDSDDTFTVSVSDGYKTYVSSGNVTYGINTFEFNDVSFDNEKIYVTVESKNNKTNYEVALYTSNNINNTVIDIVENDSSIYGNTIKHEIISRGINTGVKYNIKVYDQNNKDISFLFGINESMVINDVSKLNIIVVGDISYSDYIKVVVSSDNVKDELILYKSSSGSKDDPFVIRKSSEMKYLNNNYHFELGDDIDMKYETTNIYGDFYNSGRGWNPVDFNGHIDGKGYKISNLYSENGSLFNNVNNSSIKNISFDSFNLNDKNSNVSFNGIIRNFNNESVLSNVLIINSKINCEKTSCGLIGNMLDGSVSDVHIYKTNINSVSFGGFVSAKVSNPLNSININNIFVNDSVINTNQYYLVGNINIEDNVSDLKNINISNNIVNGNVSDLFGNQTIVESYKEKLVLKDNYIKNDNDVLNKDLFVKFNEVVWSFDSLKSMYLVLFNDEYFMDNNSVLLSMKNYVIKDDVIYNVLGGTSVKDFLNDINNKDSLNIKVYSNNNSLVKENDLITTGSYIDASLNGKSQRYYFIVSGDVNSDGKISIFDIVKINNHIVYSDKKLTGLYYSAADYNNDNNISIFDIVKINNMILGGN